MNIIMWGKNKISLVFTSYGRKGCPLFSVNSSQEYAFFQILGESLNIIIYFKEMFHYEFFIPTRHRSLKTC